MLFLKDADPWTYMYCTMYTSSYPHARILQGSHKRPQMQVSDPPK